MSRPLSDPEQLTADEEFDRLWESNASHVDGTHPLAVALRRRPRRAADDTSIQERFDRFHRSNPHVYATLVRLARQYRDRVGTTPGIGMLWEVMRWTVAMETRTDGEF